MERQKPTPNNLSNEERWNLVMSVNGMIHEKINKVTAHIRVSARPQAQEDLYDFCLDKVFKAAAYYDPARAKFTTYTSFWLLAAVSAWDRSNKQKARCVTNFGKVERKTIGEIASSQELPDGIFQKIKNERHRQAVILRFQEGLHYRKIGKRLGVSASRAQQIVVKSIKRLREVYGAVA